MSTESQTIQQTIESITAKYVGKPLPVAKYSKRERYQTQWEPSTMAKGEEVERVDFSYEIMRVALHYIVTNSQILKKKGKTFTINADNAVRLKRMLRAITGDITGDYNINKGIFLFGPPSTGKTFMMQSISTCINNAYFTRWYHLDSAPSFFYYKEITLMAKEKGSTGFIKNIFNDKKLIFIDDLGYKKETQINVFGKEDILSLLVDILYRKYLEGAIIHITCNLSLEFILDQFGQETHDRIVDMCTPVSWMGDNFRTT